MVGREPLAHATQAVFRPVLKSLNATYMMDGQIAPMAAFLGLGAGAWDADAVARATGAS